MKEQDKFWELSTGKIFKELNPEEEKILNQLLKEKENQKTFAEIEKIHRGLKKSLPLQSASQSRSWEKVSGHFKLRKVHLLKSALKYAAILIVAFLAGVLIKTNLTSQPTPLVYAELKVPLGQMSEITLYDGTHVWLNSGTTLKYPNSFGTESREVFLNGEAFFNVKPSDIPFKVKLKKSEIEVLGTSFNVVSYAEERSSQITLIEGAVRINSVTGKEITRIKPKEQITIPDELENIKIKKVNTDFYTSWTEGKIEFDEERLFDIAFRLERWYNVEINFTSAEAEDLRFSGTVLKNKPFDQIIKAIGILLPVKIKYQNKLGEKDIITISINDKPM
ncbi:DUF4974 domain-containing protein [Maribellus comscasis]|uniref:DUF4974 domain-containing protein n=1 Tax=Maribellus comscasis TaxID=2681766 RepID=A0A6I6JMM4_9BACT|nr:FecR domain-containing protein [Maribellus comscasis]QGY42220.1 DUF4974 domain-containing protein [Maribellus comscasis]